LKSTFYTISLTIEGAEEKVLELILPLKSTYIKNFDFVEQKMYF